MSEDIKNVSEETNLNKTPEEIKHMYELGETQEYIKQLREQNKQVRLKLQERLDAEAAEKAKLLEEQGKYKELFESVNPKLKEFEEKLTKTEKEKEEYLSKLKAVEDSTKKELMEELSDEHKAIASKLPLEDLREYVKINRKTTVKTDKIKTVGEIKKPYETNSVWKQELSKIGKY